MDEDTDPPLALPFIGEDQMRMAGRAAAGDAAASDVGTDCAFPGCGATMSQGDIYYDLDIDGGRCTQHKGMADRPADAGAAGAAERREARHRAADTFRFGFWENEPLGSGAGTFIGFIPNVVAQLATDAEILPELLTDQAGMPEGLSASGFETPRPETVQAWENVMWKAAPGAVKEGNDEPGL